MRFGMRTHKEKNELWAFIPKRTPGSIICYGDLQRVCRNQMTDILRRRKEILPPPCHVLIRFLLQQCQTAGAVGKCRFGVALGDDNRRQLIDGDIDLAIVYIHIRSGHAVACLQGLDDLDGLGYEHIGGLCNGEKAISSSRSTALQFPCISVSALHGGTRGFQQNQKRKCQLRYANVLFCNSKWPQ